MNVSEIRVKLADDPHDRLKAFCSVTFDACFVLHDVKVIRGPRGLFVAMPSRKMAEKCPHCGEKNPVMARFCNHCGKTITIDPTTDDQSRSKLYADVAHPINSEFRQTIERRVIQAYGEELARAKQPGYASSLDRPPERFARGVSKP